jgi:hypothetical protein
MGSHHLKSIHHCLRAVATVIVAMTLTAGVARAGGLAPLGEPPAWKEVLLPRQAIPRTQFSVVPMDGAQVLRVESNASYGTLVHAVAAGDAMSGHLAWRWRLDKAIQGTDLWRKRGDDAAVKVCAMFDMPMDAVPFVERQTLRVARALSGMEELPTATICYVWDPNQKADAVIPNAFSRRMRWIVLRGRGTALGQWETERRDLHADFLRAFGDEAKVVPALLNVVVGADADSTDGSGLAYIGEVELSR